MEKTAIIYKLLFAPTTGKVKSKADFTEKKLYLVYRILAILFRNGALILLLCTKY